MSGARAVARKGDPGTSWEAAAGVTPSTGSTRIRVLAILDDHPEGLTHDKLIAEHRRREVLFGWPRASASSLRTRCNELVRAGDVEAVPDRCGFSTSGNRAALWRAVGVHEPSTTGHDGGTAALASAGGRTGADS